ncbi:MAG: KamA family radical SAM protein [Erysipelotrichales bacterium]|nr:KamA family radical SAM protein [Erysipelotrichales bacterium]
MKILNLQESIKININQIDFTLQKEMEAVNEIYPVKISEYYAKLASKNKAVFLQAFPSNEELCSNDFSEIDPLSEIKHEIIPGLVHKYSNKAIILTTNKCFMNCRHCTRKRIMHSKHQSQEPNFKLIFDYIKKHQELNDILLTGGDVLTLPDETILYLISELSKIKHINTIRIGTRAPVTFPERINYKLFKSISKYKNVWLNTQFNHPCEVTKESISACNIIQSCGIPICNQTVILKGVNDKYKILRDLCLKLVHNRIMPYYLYQCDNVIGVSHFAVSPQFGAEVIKRMRTELPGMAIPRYIIDAQNDGGKIIAEYSNVIDFQNNKAELIDCTGRHCVLFYGINSPKND